MSVGRDIYVVRCKTTVIDYQRSFETLQEAKDYIYKEQPGFNKMVDLSGQHKAEFSGGALWSIKTMRLGHYEDGS